MVFAGEQSPAELSAVLLLATPLALVEAALVVAGLAQLLHVTAVCTIAAFPVVRQWDIVIIQAL